MSRKAFCIVLFCFSILLFATNRLYCKQGNEENLRSTAGYLAGFVLSRSDFLPDLFFLHYGFLFLIAHKTAVNVSFSLTAVSFCPHFHFLTSNVFYSSIEFFNFTYLSTFFIIRLVFSLTLRSIFTNNKE